ncbi:hypothetical protein QUB37_10695 [Microcoleus sp. AT3-A2]|uniref:hypothetical protein n=1 Tax=Microcoleus sp. AT3-A2 TaxID=2818610 RepID=UPI002FD4677C
MADSYTLCYRIQCRLLTNSIYCYALMRRLRQGILDEIAAAKGKQEENGNFKCECDRP